MRLNVTFFLLLTIFSEYLTAQTSNTWVSGSNTRNNQGAYGTQGVGSTSNIPGAREISISWTENDTLWLFGGYGRDGSGNLGSLNDLWKFDQTTRQWTWVSGSNTRDQQGTYGTQGVAGPSNIPGARYSSISWTENDTLWLFGGVGRDGSGNFGFLNDLWKFNQTTRQWTWVSGSNTRNQPGTYGTQGVAGPSNIPGARQGSISWTENDTLWLFGGYGREGSGNFGRLNDLWKFDLTTRQWTWVSGSNTRDQQGTYGTQGVAGPSNIPGAREMSISWTENDTLWLFGGYGYDGSGIDGRLNDLWKFDQTTRQWTWVSGSNTRDQQGTYGTQGVAGSSNIPGARQASISWTESDTLWLFGGGGYDGSGNFGELNDLWKFDQTTRQWTWVSGSSTNGQQGTYGTQGVGASSNIPGARFASISWTENDTLWLLGGYGRDGSGNYGQLNDLWAMATSVSCITANITMEPSNATLCAGGDTLFGLTATGTISGYKWQRNTGGGWSDLGGETNDTLVLSAVTSGMNGYTYRCIAYAACGNDTSAVVNLTVKTPVVFTQEPNDTSLCPGEGTTLQVATSGNLDSLIWQYNDGLGWNIISNANSNQLVLGKNGWDTLAIQDFEISPKTPTWNYSGTPSNLLSGVSSGSAAPPNSPIGINGSRAWNVNTVSGGNPLTFDYIQVPQGADSIRVSFRVAAMNLNGSTGGPDDLDYVKLDYSTDGGSNWVNRITVRGAVNNNSYWPYDAATVASAHFLPASLLTFQPINSGLQLMDGIGRVELNFDDTTSLIGIRITPRSSSSGDDWLIDNVILAASYSSQPVVSGRQYRCVAYGACGNDTTAVRTLTVRPNTSLTSEPINDSICDGGAFQFSSIAIGHNLNFVWQSDSGAGAGNLKNLSVNNDTLIAANVPYASNGWLYRIIAQGTCGIDTSSLDTLTVRANPDITSITSSRNPSYNGYAPMQCSNLTATTTGGMPPYTYSWTPSGSGNPLNVCPTIGTWYKATVTDSYGCQDTMSFKQSVIDATSTFPGRVTMCIKNNRTNRYSTLPVLLSSVPYYLNLAGAGNTLGACGAIPSKQGDAGFEDFADYYKVYPNPFTSELNIEMVSLFEEEVNIDLTDMTGRVVKTIFNGNMYEGDLARFTLDASDLPNGLYFVRYTSNTDIRVNKVQLMR